MENLSSPVIPAVESVDKWSISTFPSFLRRQESSGFRCLGIPAFAGMTANRCFATPSQAGIPQRIVPVDPCLRRDDGFLGMRAFLE